MRRLIILPALLNVAHAEWTGILGLNFDSDVPIEQRTMHCPNGYITGLTVKHGRDEKTDQDLYDFRFKCGGRRWGAWAGMPFSNLLEEKTLECPLQQYVTGLEVKQGRKEFGDLDTYDFKLQCSGVWGEYMGLQFKGEKSSASKECPAGTMAWAWRSYRGFVKKNDRDFYEFDLNCKPASEPSAAVRRTPNLAELGLPHNVFIWSTKEVAKWLHALGLGEYAQAFVDQHIQGDVIFLLLESHLQDLGMAKIGDRLYFMEVLTQLHDATNRLAKYTGGQLSSSRSIPNLQKSGLPLEVVSWSVKEVAKFLGALGLAEWTEVFLTHRIQGDVMFSLTEVTLAEMGVSKIGDRLYLHDCLQSLYEELTAWKQAKEKQLRYGQGAKQKVAVPALPGGAGSAAAPTAGYGGGGGGGGYAGGGGGGGGGGAGGKGKALLQQMVNQGYTVEEIMKLAKARPELAKLLFS